MARVKRSKEDLRRMLDEQVEFLAASAEAFDRGFESESKRLAVAIRILLHDTKMSKSLLGQLELKSRRFCDSALDLEPGNVATHSGLVMMAINRGTTRYVAMLDEMPTEKWTTFDSWWHKPVFVDDRRAMMTREQLVLAVANQDGGAHVDPALDEVYHRLTRDNSAGWVEVTGQSERPLPEPAAPSIRQIAHEVLKSLVPGYAKKAEHKAELFAGGAAVFNQPFPPSFTSKVGRNNLCPCGSGRKYKRCHGQPGAASNPR